MRTVSAVALHIPDVQYRKGKLGRTPMEDKPGATVDLEGESTDAVRVYFWGTAIARAVLGSLYFPPHYLKLSQVSEVRIHYV